MRKAGSFLLGAIFGGILGSAAVLLLAPGSGKETQTAIRERFANLRIELERAIAEKRAALESELQEYKNQY
jgi:gas vesicle protein